MRIKDESGSPRNPSTTWRMLAISALAMLGLVLSACGASESEDEGIGRPAPSPQEFPSAAGKSIDDILSSSSPSDLVVSPAATVFEIGENRFPFGVFNLDQSQADDVDVALYFAKSPQSPVQGPIPARVDSLQTKPAFRSQGADAPGEVRSAYVADPVRFDRTGPWLAIALIKSGQGFEATRLPSPTVAQYPSVAQVGSRAPRVRTLTAADVGGRLSEIDTRQPPSSMHAVDFKDVAGKKPTVLVFATPALCRSRVCGPVVDVAEQVKAEVGDDVAFIHQEVFNDNDPNRGVRPQLKSFGLQTEPWIFLIDRDGRIKQRIEGAIGVEELRDAVEKLESAS